MNILVCHAQVPLVRGGAEDQVEGLVHELRTHGHRADLVALPFKWYPKREILRSALAWRLLDLSECNGVRVDRIITTKFPSYAARHSHKIVWLVHQLRQVYDWYGTPLSDFTDTPEDQHVRAQVMEMDRRMLGEAAGLFTTSKNNAARLKKFIGLDAEQLYSPPRLTGHFRAEEPGDYILSIGRLDKIKRVDLLIQALHEVRTARAIIAGAGPAGKGLRELAETLGIADRVTFCGRVDDETLLDLYARALAVYFGPVDEDYGFVTVEAFMSARPVITTFDAGGVLEFVEHERTGLVCEPKPSSLAHAIARVYRDTVRAQEWGAEGKRRVASITWHRVLERLTA